MVKIADVVSVIVRNNILYSLLLSSGLVNHTSLANKIHSQVEAISGKKVKINTIVKVLTGMEVKKVDTMALEILRKSNIMAEYKYTEVYHDTIEEIGKHTMLAVNEGDMYKCIEKSSTTNDLALIRVVLPKESAGEPGITLLITEYLSASGLKTKNIYRLDTEIWITVSINHAGLVLDKLSNFFYNSQI